MSLETWKEEFYPKDAENAISSDLEAINHSLQKWKGALEENLKKHEVSYNEFEIVDKKLDDSEYLQFSWTTCALCQRYYNNDDEQEIDEGPFPCYSLKLETTCPIVRYQGGYACDDQTPKTKESIYIRSLDNPQLMVDLLENTKNYLLEKEKFTNSTNE